MAIGGAALRFGSMFFHGLEFLCASLILGIYSYFLASLAQHNTTIPKWEQAVEGISGAGVLYTLLALVFVCCLGGKTFFALIGLVMNLLFCGAFIAIAVLTRKGASRCTGFVETPLANGDASSHGATGSNTTFTPTLRTACQLNTACFAAALAGALFFLISTILQFFLSRHNKKEKRFGPGPSNNYTSGTAKPKFWQRKQKTVVRDPEVATTIPASGHAALAPGYVHDIRPSHDTAYTGTTVEAPHGYENPNKPLHGGYQTAPLVNGTYNPPTVPYPQTGTATNY